MQKTCSISIIALIGECFRTLAYILLKQCLSSAFYGQSRMRNFMMLFGKIKSEGKNIWTAACVEMGLDPNNFRVSWKPTLHSPAEVLGGTRNSHNAT